MNERDLVLYGALFHDIGKVLQRVPGEKRELHSLKSGQIIYELTDNEELKFIVEHHHESSFKKVECDDKTLKIISAIVCEADTLSSGERIGTGKTINDKPLQSIFCDIQLEGKKKCDPHYQLMQELDIEKYQHPVPNTKVANYEDMWKILKIELVDVEHHNFDTILSILKKHLWCVPAAYFFNVPDISIYEHSRLAAAIAVCMYDYYTKNKMLDFNQIEDADGFRNKTIFKDDDVEKYLLVCGDITGIQNYIYNIAYKGAAKNLKGRSLFVQQLLDSIAQKVLDEFKLPYCNLLYSSGGKFYALVPLLPDTEKQVENLEKKLMKEMLDEYDLSLGIVMASVRLCDNDFKRYKKDEGNECRIIDKWDEIGKFLERKKKQKYGFLVKDEFFEPQEPSGNTIQCSATGIDLCYKGEPKEEDVFHEPAEAGELKFIRHQLKNKKIYQYVDKSDPDFNEKYLSDEQFNTITAGFAIRKNAEVIYHGVNEGIKIVDEDTVAFHDLETEFKQDFSKVTILNKVNEIGKAFSKDIGQRFKFYGGPWSFDFECNPYEYDSKKDEHAKFIIGPNMPGVLRMDVDNLGQIFKEGFKENASFSRIIQLSSMLDFFFAGLLNKLRRLKWNPFEGINDTNGEMEVGEIAQIVYSGGDDVCIVGTWYVLPDIAKWINDEFRKFVCNNDSFGISAGITFFPQKYPVFKAARDAGKEEDRAKSAEGKNSICFLDTVMSWKDFDEVGKKVKQLYGFITKGKELINQDTGERSIIKLNRGIVNWFNRIYEEFDKACDKKIAAKWRWRAAYSLHRLSQRYSDFKKDIDDIAARLVIKQDSGREYIFLLNVISRWTELLTKTEV